MTTYNTQNPLGSTDPRDLYDNAENLDEAVNSSADTFQDRLGKSRLTWEGIVKAGTGDAGVIVPVVQQAVQDVVDGVDGQVAVAQSAADRAEAASDAAFINADVYPDIETGRASVLDGEQFQVVIGAEIVRYMRDSASAETELARYPSSLMSMQVAGRSLSNDQRIKKIEGDGLLERGAYLLLKDEPEGLAISLAGNPQVYAKRQDGSTRFSGSVDDFFGPVKSLPVMVQTEEGSVSWARHNLAPNSANPESWNTAGSGTSVQSGFLDSKGGLDSGRVTLGNSGSVFFRNPSKDLVVGHNVRFRAIVRIENTRYIRVYLDFDTLKSAIFDLASGEVVETSGTGISAEIKRFDENGSALPLGFYWISLTVPKSQGVIQDYCINAFQSLGDKTTQLGDSFFMEEPMIHLGESALPYYKNETLGPVSEIPVTMNRGKLGMYFPSQTAVVTKHSEDLTNPAWVKTGGVATFDQLGPHMETCSRFTANNAGATCMQAESYSGSRVVFAPFLKPVTLTGNIEVTVDGGVTWKDVTSALKAGTYTRVFSDRTDGVVEIGIRLTAAGDSVDVALAVGISQYYQSTAIIPSYERVGGWISGWDSSTGKYYLALADYLEDPSVFSLYLQSHGDIDDLGDPIGIPLNIVDSNKNLLGGIRVTEECSTYFTTNGGTVEGSETVGNSHTSYSLSQNAEQQFFSFNGSACHFMHRTPSNPGVQYPNDSELSFESSMSITSLVLSGVFKNSIELPDWQYRRGSLVPLRGSAVVATHGAEDDALTDSNREPTVCVLSDDGESADLLITWMERRKISPTFHGEAPARASYRKYRYNKTTGQLSPLTSVNVIYEPPGWMIGEDHVQSIWCFVVPEGPHKGRIVAVMTILYGNGFGFGRSIYSVYSDQDGNPGTWSQPQVIVSSSVYGEGNTVVGDPSGSYAILPSDHPIAPNRLVSIIYDGTNIIPIYTDNFGGTDGTDWQVGQPSTGPGTDTINETNVAYLADGRLIATHRVGPENNRAYSISEDAGVSFSPIGLLPNWLGSSVSAGLAQIDPTGAYGPVGKLVMTNSMSHGGYYRSGIAVSVADDETFEFKNRFYPFSKYRKCGYSSVKPLFGGSHLAIVTEVSEKLSSDNILCIVRLPN